MTLLRREALILLGAGLAGGARAAEQPAGTARATAQHD